MGVWWRNIIIEFTEWEQPKKKEDGSEQLAKLSACCNTSARHNNRSRIFEHPSGCTKTVHILICNIPKKVEDGSLLTLVWTLPDRKSLEACAGPPAIYHLFGATSESGIWWLHTVGRDFALKSCRIHFTKYIISHSPTQISKIGPRDDLRIPFLNQLILKLYIR